MKVEDSTLAVVRALERMGVQHYVTGSLASSLHGDPRATNDADLVAVLLPMHFKRLKAELGDRFYLDSAARYRIASGATCSEWRARRRAGSSSTMRAAGAKSRERSTSSSVCWPTQLDAHFQS